MDFVFCLSADVLGLSCAASDMGAHSVALLPVIPMYDPCW